MRNMCNNNRLFFNSLLCITIGFVILIICNILYNYQIVNNDILLIIVLIGYIFVITAKCLYELSVLPNELQINEYNIVSNNDVKV